MTQAKTDKIPKPTKQCLVCNRDDSFGVCVRCDALVTARKVYRRYYKNSAQIRDAGIYGEKKDKALKFYMDEAKKYFCDSGFEVLTKEELDLFWQTFHFETKKLKDNFEYMCKVLHYDSGNSQFSKEEPHWHDALRRYYKGSMQ